MQHGVCKRTSKPAVSVPVTPVIPLTPVIPVAAAALVDDLVEVEAFSDNDSDVQELEVEVIEMEADPDI